MATTITKRNTGTASGGATKRVSGVISVGNTKRVAATALGGQTARVDRDDYTSSIYDPWGGSWGQTWENWWLVTLGPTPLGHTIRTEIPQQAARFLQESGFLLLLENGSHLLFENVDTSAEGQHVKRVAEAVN